MENITEKINRMMELDSINVLKEGKSTVKEVNIRPLIMHVEIGANNIIPPGYEDFKSTFIIDTVFKAGSSANLRPDLFVEALRKYTAIDVKTVRIHRKELYVERDGKLLSPLDKAVLK